MHRTPRPRAQLLALLAAAALPLAALPAAAQSTSTTFEVASGGDLSVSVPGPQTLSIGRDGGSVAFGDVTVTDARRTLVRSWSVTVSAPDGFEHTTEDVTISPGEVTYEPGVLTFVSGVLDGSVVTPTSRTLDSGSPVVQSTGVSTLGLLSDQVSWTPTLDVDPAEGLPAGSYTGTITHSISG
jgi:hypothetical protein